MHILLHVSMLALAWDQVVFRVKEKPKGRVFFVVAFYFYFFSSKQRLSSGHWEHLVTYG